MATRQTPHILIILTLFILNYISMSTYISNLTITNHTAGHRSPVTGVINFIYHRHRLFSLSVLPGVLPTLYSYPVSP